MQILLIEHFPIHIVKHNMFACIDCNIHIIFNEPFLSNIQHPVSNSFLPVRLMNETAVRVEVQHEDNVHPGPCSSECQQQLTKVILISKPNSGFSYNNT